MPDRFDVISGYFPMPGEWVRVPFATLLREHNARKKDQAWDIHTAFNKALHEESRNRDYPILTDGRDDLPKLRAQFMANVVKRTRELLSEAANA